MRKIAKTALLFIAIALSPALKAQDKYSLTIQGVYDYNTTFRSQGGADIIGHLPINKYFEGDAAFEFLSPQIYAGTIIARPKFPLKVGELFLEGAIHMRGYGTFDTGTFATAASFGYRMDYVSVQLGLESLTLLDLQKGGTNVSEPFNLLYRVVVNVRPSTSPWNITLAAGNFNYFQFERFYQPIFSLGGHYDFTPKLTALAEVDLKPSGMFNTTVHFNEVIVRAGITVKF